MYGTKFATLQGARTGVFSGLSFYENAEFRISFSLVIDIGDDQLFYELLAFVKAFFIEKSHQTPFHGAGKTFGPYKMVPSDVPAVGFTGQFLKLFSRVKL